MIMALSKYGPVRMRLEVHTFDAELINALMEKGAVQEGEALELGRDARLTYVRTFVGRVKHFPQIIYFEVEVLSDTGAAMVSSWLFNMVGKRNIEKVMVEYQDVKMDAGLMAAVLNRGR